VFRACSEHCPHTVNSRWGKTVHLVLKPYTNQFRPPPSQLGVFSGGNSFRDIEVEGYVPKEDNDRGSALDVVGPGYFSTLGVPIALGRESWRAIIASMEGALSEYTLHRLMTISGRRTK
jgi:hypothetical protein